MSEQIQRTRRASHDLTANRETPELPVEGSTVTFDIDARDVQAAALVAANQLDRNQGSDPTGERLRHKIMRCGGPDDDGPREEIAIPVLRGTVGDNAVTVRVGQASITLPFTRPTEIDTDRTAHLILSIPVKR
jgi:hypothetical protein